MRAGPWPSWLVNRCMVLTPQEAERLASAWRVTSTTDPWEMPGGWFRRIPGWLAAKATERRVTARIGARNRVQGAASTVDRDTREIAVRIDHAARGAPRRSRHAVSLTGG